MMMMMILSALPTITIIFFIYHHHHYNLITIITIITIGGILPYGACFVELFFIMSSIWMDQYYYVFGFLLIVYLILAVTCAEVTIVLCYFQLCAEDYRWWWRSFLTSGSTAVYIFIYSIIYFHRLESNMPVTYLLYFGYMGVISLGAFLITGQYNDDDSYVDQMVVMMVNVMMVMIIILLDVSYLSCWLGTIGFFSCLYFNYQIYGSIKVDQIYCDDYDDYDLVKIMIVSQ